MRVAAKAWWSILLLIITGVASLQMLAWVHNNWNCFPSERLATDHPFHVAEIAQADKDGILTVSTRWWHRANSFIIAPTYVAGGVAIHRIFGTDYLHTHYIIIILSLIGYLLLTAYATRNGDTLWASIFAIMAVALFFGRYQMVGGRIPDYLAQLCGAAGIYLAFREKRPEIAFWAATLSTLSQPTVGGIYWVFSIVEYIYINKGVPKTPKEMRSLAKTVLIPATITATYAVSFLVVYHDAVTISGRFERISMSSIYRSAIVAQNSTTWDRALWVLKQTIRFLLIPATLIFLAIRSRKHEKQDIAVKAGLFAIVAIYIIWEIAQMLAAAKIAELHIPIIGQLFPISITTAALAMVAFLGSEMKNNKIPQAITAVAIILLAATTIVNFANTTVVHNYSLRTCNENALEMAKNTISAIPDTNCCIIKIIRNRADENHDNLEFYRSAIYYAAISNCYYPVGVVGELVPIDLAKEYQKCGENFCSAECTKHICGGRSAYTITENGNIIICNHAGKE